MAIRIYLTGRVALEVDDHVSIDERQFRGKQGRLVFVYLVWERSRPVSKEELASVLWPEQQSAAWETALNSLTSRLSSLPSMEELSERGYALPWVRAIPDTAAQRRGWTRRRPRAH